MFDSIKPGQTIHCTVVKAPYTEDDIDTVIRLMRNDVSFRRRLNNAQKIRRQNLLVRSRGGRPWAVRKNVPTIAQAEKGATWTMRYYPHIAPDFRAVSEFIQVKAG